MNTLTALPATKIDVHAHYVPDFYRQAAQAAGHLKPDGMPGFPDWTVGAALATMDELEITTSVLSISSPGVHFGDDTAARNLARAVNDEGARIVALHPTRFGLFASLPLPDVQAALQEIDYALDVLKVDGIVLKTSYRGIYLGDPRFDMVLAELNRRHAVVFIHPTSAYCPACCNGLNYPAPMLDFMFETTRAVTHLIFSGSLTRYQHMQVIVPHAGAVLPTLSDRIAGMVPLLSLTQPLSDVEIFATLRRLYYDLAGTPMPRMIGSLLSITDVSRLLYGSDWPFTPIPAIQRMAGLIDSSPLFDAATLARIYHGNALELLPRLKVAQEKPV